MSSNVNIQPRIRAYGNSRIEVTKRARNEQEWQNLWREPLNPFPFNWGGAWKQCIEYRVDDFASEVGFYIDILGMPVCAFSPTYAQFTSPNMEFTFAVTAVADSDSVTPPDAIRLQFQVEDLMDTIVGLESRGILFEKRPPEEQEDSIVAVACFRSPHGIPIDLVGEIFVEDNFEEQADFENEDSEADDMDDELESFVSDDENELEDQLDQFEEGEEVQNLAMPDESVEDDVVDENVSDLPTWMSLLARQDAQRSRSRQSQAYPRPSKTSRYRIPYHEPASAEQSRKTRTNGELTYSALEDEEQEDQG